MLSYVVPFLYAFVLFFVLTPGVLVTLPRKASKMVVAAVHAVIFALIWALTHNVVVRAISREGAVGKNDDKHKPGHKVGADAGRNTPMPPALPISNKIPHMPIR